MKKWSQYKIRYEPEWEEEDFLRDWLQPVSGDIRNARCKVCQVVLPAHHAGLCRHAQEAKHLKRLADEKQPASKDIVTSRQKVLEKLNFSSQNAGWIKLSPDDSMNVRCELCNIDLLADLKCLQEHVNSFEHQSLSTVESPLDEDLKILIDRDFTADSSESSTQGSFQKPLKSSSIIGQSNVHLVDSTHDMFLSNSVIQIKVERVMEQPLEHTVLLGSDGSQLELVCENHDDEYESQARLTAVSSAASLIPHSFDLSESTRAGETESVVPASSGLSETGVLELADTTCSLNKAKRSKVFLEPTDGEPPAKKNVIRTQRLKVFDTEWLAVPLFRDWIEECAEDQSRARCRFCQCLLGADMKLLQHHALSNRHLRNLDLSEIDSLENNEPIDVNEIDRYSMPDDCEANEEITDGRRKRKSKDGKKWSRYKKVYRREWESDPTLQGWVAPVAGQRTKAACKYCTCILRAHYSDLRHHASSAKHTKNEVWHKSGAARHAEKPVYFQSFNHKDAVPQDMSPPNQQSSSSGCYVVQMSTWSKYRKRYNKQWEQDPILRGWIMPVPGDDSRARCRYCRLLLRAHYSDLRNHARTTKHASNVAFGRPCTEAHGQVSINRTATNRMSFSSTRRRKLDSGGLMDDTMSLERPDETLASLKSLTNLAHFGWEEPRGPETTLILHNGMHLDEQLAASLPQTPGLRFRVKKESLSSGYEQTTVFGKKRKDKMNSSSSGAVCSEEISDDTLKHIARSMTLWEFLMLKVNRGRIVTDRRVRIADILTEFAELHKKVKHIGRQMLTAIPDDVQPAGLERVPNRIKKTLMLESRDLAQCLNLPTGRYEINQSPDLLSDPSLVDCRPLIPPMRRRVKLTQREPTASGRSRIVPSSLNDFGTSGFESVDGCELRQYVIEQSSGLDAQSLLQGNAADGSGQQLVLVAADSGELLLQCDLRDYQNMVGAAGSSGAGFATLDDIRSLVHLQANEAVASASMTATEDFSNA